MNYYLYFLLPCFQGALSLGQGAKTVPSSASLRHGKTLSFHDHVLKKTKHDPSGLQNYPAATTALAANQGGGLLDGSAGVHWMGADGGPVGEVEGEVVFAEERNSKAVAVQGRGLVGLEGGSGSSLPDGTVGKRWLAESHASSARRLIDCTRSFSILGDLKEAVAGYAYDCTTNPSDCMNNWCVQEVTSFDQLFSGMSTFNEDISSWDTSNVITMSKTFDQATAFNGDISSWDTSKVTTMEGLFVNAHVFNQDISKWDTRQVTSMRIMFYQAYVFNTYLSSWDTSQVNNMNYMFYRAKKFNQDISSWDISQVTSMNNMFQLAEVFNQNLCSWDYSSSFSHVDMFLDSACTDKGSPGSSAGPWCASEDECLLPPPWVINFVDVTADFGINSTEELIVKYEIGKDREVETTLYEKDCSTDITDITVDSIPVFTYKNFTHTMLTVGHSFDKTMIANSTIWNATTTEIEICQVVRLIVPAVGTAEMMVISEDKRVVAIDFDLSVDFELDDTTLGAATIEAGSGSTDVTNYVEACKCDGLESFTCNTAPLVPNSALFVCIKSKSTDVEIDSLQTMTVTQDDETMTVIEDDKVLVASITSREYVPTSNVVVVSTRVPANLFTYAEGRSIVISGEVVMKLADGNRRKLRTDIIVGDAEFDDNKKAPFELMIGLQDEMVVEWESSVSSATGVASASKDVGMFVMVFASAYIML